MRSTRSTTVTLAEVARHAGVSQSTVSYVLSGKRAISSGTRRRVERSIAALGYHPHAGARALASRRASVIALMVPLRPELHVPVMMEFAVAVVTAARAFDHDVLLLTSAEGPEGVRRVADAALVDGLIVMDVELRDERIPTLLELDRPSVLIGVPENAAGLTCVDLDFFAAGALCVDHLADLGHRRLALIGVAPEVYRRGSGFAERMLAGFESRSRQRGMDAVHHACDATHAGVERLVEHLFAREPATTGIVIHNEGAVRPLLEALRAAGRRIPEDVSIVALCPDPLAEHTSPPLSSVLLPADALGRRAVELLMSKLAGDAAIGATLLPPRLTVRRSAAPAARPAARG
jgi:DNA-binding LacI/PurR family transcriptional regulator